MRLRRGRNSRGQASVHVITKGASRHADLAEPVRVAVLWAPLGLSLVVVACLAGILRLIIDREGYYREIALSGEVTYPQLEARVRDYL